jgi:hypothetical protein
MLGKAGLAARSIESWSHRLKEGRTDLVSRTAIPVIKKLCLSDYLVAVAQRPA